MTYRIEHLEYHMHAVSNADGKLFEGTLVHCEEYVKALSYIVPLETIENPSIEFLGLNKD
jgi:hypothetical protein